MNDYATGEKDSPVNDYLDDYDPDYDYDDLDPEYYNCHYCGGDGFMFGCDLDDPLWYDDDTAYKCPCCLGSGNAKDCTFW